jgi:hypothetical protein
MTLDELTEALKSESKEASLLIPSNQLVKVELVVLAMPLSKKIAKTLIDIGVKHVVSFGFENFVKYPSLFPMVKDMIEKFCLKFYQKLFANE